MMMRQGMDLSPYMAKPQNNKGKNLRVCFGITAGITFTLSFICLIVTLIAVLAPCGDNSSKKGDSSEEERRALLSQIPENVALDDDVFKILRKKSGLQNDKAIVTLDMSDANIWGFSSVTDKIDMCRHHCYAYNSVNVGHVSQVEDLANKRCFHWEFSEDTNKCFMFNEHKTEAAFKENNIVDSENRVSGFIGGNRYTDETKEFKVLTNYADVVTRFFVDVGVNTDLPAGELQTELNNSAQFKEDFINIMIGAQTPRAVDGNKDATDRDYKLKREDIKIEHVAVQYSDDLYLADIVSGSSVENAHDATGQFHAEQQPFELKYCGNLLPYNTRRSLLAKSFRGGNRKLQAAPTRKNFDIVVRWRVMSDMAEKATDASKIMNGMFECFDNCIYRTGDENKFGIVQNDQNVGSQVVADLGVKYMQKEFMYTMATFSEKNLKIDNVNRVYMRTQGSKASTAILRKDQLVKSEDWLAYRPHQELDRESSDVSTEASVEECREKCESKADCSAWQHSDVLASTCDANSICKYDAASDDATLSSAGNQAALVQMKDFHPRACAVDATTSGLQKSSGQCKLFKYDSGPNGIRSQRFFFSRNSGKLNTMSGMSKFQDFAIVNEEGEEEEQWYDIFTKKRSDKDEDENKKKSSGNMSCETKTALWVSFLFGFLVFFGTSVLSLVIVIVSKVKENKRQQNMDAEGQYDPNGQFGHFSEHSLEMQDRWLKHKAMLESRSERAERSSSASSRHSKKSKRSKSSSSKKSKKNSKKNASNDSTVAYPDQVVAGQQPQTLYVTSQGPQTQMYGYSSQGQVVSQNQPIRVVMQPQASPVIRSQPQQIVVRTSNQQLY